MSRASFFAILLILGACATHEAQTTASVSRDCFRSNEIVAHRALDDEHILLESGTADYIVTVRGRANDLRLLDPLVIRSEDGRLCTGNGLGVSLSVGEPPRLYHIVNIARAPTEQAGAS